MFKRMVRGMVFGLAVVALCASAIPVAAYAPPEHEGSSAPIVFTGTKVLGDPNGVQPMTIVTPGGGRPGAYIARDYDNLDPGFWPITGGYITVIWKDIETSEGFFNWNAIDNFIAALATKGKPAALQVMTYAGPRGGVLIPDWLRSRYPSLILNMYYKYPSTVEPWRSPKSGCGSPGGNALEGLRYWDSRFLNAYRTFINALAARYKNDSRVEFVMVGAGLYGETQPANDCYDYYLLDAGLDYQNPARSGMTSWTSVVQQIAQYFADAFRAPDGVTVLKSAMLPAGSTYFHTCGRKEYMDAARAVGIGDTDTGLYADQASAVIPDKPGFEGCGRLDPLILTQPTLPIGGEVYWYLGPNHVLAYWTLLGALGNKMDYVTVDYAPNDTTNDGWLFANYAGNPRTDIISYSQWGLPYFGKKATNTSSVWVVMRDSGFSYYPQHGNYSFYLTQDDSVGGGQTKLVTYRGTVHPSDYSWMALISHLVMKGEAYNTTIQTGLDLGGSWSGSKEAWITRRTDQGTGNRYMWFKIDDGYLYGGSNPATIKVTYFDVGTDTWKLDYDGAGGVQRTAGIVTKTNSRTWKTQTFNITDARMGNGLLGGSDFRIDCNNDGDEYVHMVDVRKGGGGTVNYDIPVRLGWNMVSIPLTLANTNTEAVMSSLSGKYSKVYAYDAFDSLDPWKVYDLSLPPFLNDLSQINNTKGLWLYATQNATFSVSGSWPSSTNIPLKTGWNLVGYPSQTTRAVADALSSIAGKYTKVYTYYAFDDVDPWKVYDVSLPPFLNDLSQLQPGQGYWIYVTQDCTWVVTG